MGKIDTDLPKSTNCLLIFSLSSQTNKEINNTIKKFWILENVPEKPYRSSDNIQCEDIIIKTTLRNEDDVTASLCSKIR